MKALITGASSGIGREIALYLSDLGYDIIVVARNELALKELQREVKTKVEIVSMDLTDRVNCWKLHEMYKNQPIEVLVNNAGFGVHGPVTDTSLEKDLELTSPQIYEIKYSGNKQYIEVNVISTKNNPYIIFCQKKYLIYFIIIHNL